MKEVTKNLLLIALLCCLLAIMAYSLKMINGTHTLLKENKMRIENLYKDLPTVNENSNTLKLTLDNIEKTLSKTSDSAGINFDSVPNHQMEMKNSFP